MGSSNIGNQLREARKKQNITQVALAKKIGKTPQLICDIEAGRKKPSIGTLGAIVKVLHLKSTLADFF